MISSSRFAPARISEEDHRVVSGGVGLEGDDPAHETERLSRGAVHLGRAAHRVGVLDAAAVGVRCVDRASFQQPSDVVCGDDLAIVGPRIVNPGVERFDRSAEGVNRQRRRDVCRAGEPLGADERKRGDRR